MIKVIAFDLVGVLFKENDFVLNSNEEKIEKLFGNNPSDISFISHAKNLLPELNETQIIKSTKNIINNIYDIRVSVKDLSLIKNNFKNVKIIIATNHVSFVNEYIQKIYGNVIDSVYISANMDCFKPDIAFYNKITKDMNIQNNELLFVDDSINNIDAANKLNIQTIHVTKGTNILNEILKKLN